MSGILNMEKSYMDTPNIYESKFNFHEYGIDEKTSKEITEKEEIIIKNMTQIQRNRAGIAEELWHINKLLANHKNGVFYDYLEYIKMKKDTAYRLIDMWNIFLKIKDKKVFEQTHSIIKEIKNGLKKGEIEEAEIIEIIDDESPKNKIQELRVKNINQVTRTLNYEEEIRKIDKKIEKYEKKIEVLREEKKQLQEKNGK